MKNFTVLIVILLLIALNILIMNMDLSKNILNAAILIITSIKFALIFFYFMEMRLSNFAWKITIMGLFLVFMIILSILVLK